MADIWMPSAFPTTDFRAFFGAAVAFFPSLMSDEALYDPQEKRRHFDWSWQAVRYRYRSCYEGNAQFKELLADPSEKWKAGWGDEELMYELERCIYYFFMSGLSVFDSFVFCLYFYGNAVQPLAFRDVGIPRNITRRVTTNAFQAAFPQTKLTSLLVGLSTDIRFKNLDLVRNLVAHRISGRRRIRASSTTHADGTSTSWREERWHLPGTDITLDFDEELLQRHLDDITDLLAALALAAREFAEDQQALRVRP